MTAPQAAVAVLVGLMLGLLVVLWWAGEPSVVEEGS